MPFDAQMLVTAGSALAAIVATYGWWASRSNGQRYWKLLREVDAMNAAYADTIRTQNAKLLNYELKEQRRIEKCREAAAKGKAAQAARAAEAKAQRTREANARTAATLKAINDGALKGIRSRAQVVAPVKAKRTRAKKSAGGVAPSKAG